MANRRMFARTVTNSGRFLRLSAQARLLYYDLGMEADDEGFAESYVRLLVTGSQETHLRELEEHGFLEILDQENLLVHITDWQTNNLIRKDRFSPSFYHDRYPQYQTETKEEPAAAEPEPEGQPEEHREETSRQQDGCFLGDTRLTQVRLGKDRLGKDRLAQDRAGKNRTGYGERGTLAAGAREEGQPEAALAKQGETEINFEKMRQKSMETLLKSKHFTPPRASPLIHPSV